MLRSLSVAVGGGGAVSLLAAVGWPGLVLTVAAVVIAVLAACWVLSDGDRTRRLVSVIEAMHRGDRVRGQGRSR